MDKKNLNEMLADSRMILSHIDESNGDISPEIEKRMKELDFSIPEKIDNIAFVISQIEMQKNNFIDQCKMFKQAAESCERHVEYIKNYLVMIMRTYTLKELNGHSQRYVCSKARHKLNIYNENEIPIMYKEVKYIFEINKDLLRKNMESGWLVPGASLEDSFSLRKYMNTKI